MRLIESNPSPGGNQCRRENGSAKLRTSASNAKLAPIVDSADTGEDDIHVRVLPDVADGFLNIFVRRIREERTIR